VGAESQQLNETKDKENLMSEKTITQYYADDHDRLDGLFGQFQALKQSDKAKALDFFRQFKAGLERHILWEEEILFPTFEAKTGMHGGGPTAVMRSEHVQIRRILDLVAAKEGDGTDAAEKELLDVLGAHNWKEEQILYPSIDQQVSLEERGTVYARMDQTSDRLNLPVSH
jgi:iron-sulfur cluster repair protein YtfE (RIC family)